MEELWILIHIYSYLVHGKVDKVGKWAEDSGICMDSLDHMHCIQDVWIQILHGVS